MKPASTTSSTPRSLEPVAERARRARRGRAWSAMREHRRLDSGRARRARARARPARLEATPTTSIPSAPWTRVEERLEVRCPRRRPGRRRGRPSAQRRRHAQHRVGPAGRLEPARLDQLVDAREDVGPAHVRRGRRTPAGRRRSCARSSSCARRAGSPRRWCARPPGARHAATEMIASSRSPIAAGIGRRRRRARSAGSQTSQQAAARPRGRRASPKWRRIAARRQVVSSTYAQISRYWRQRARAPSSIDARQSAAARPSNARRSAAGDAVRRRRRRRDHARAREVAEQRAQPLAVAARGRARARRASSE